MTTIDQPPTWVVALISPEGEPEAWLTHGGHVTPAAWGARVFASEAEASAALLLQTRIVERDGRRWKPVRREAVSA